MKLSLAQFAFLSFLGTVLADPPPPPPPPPSCDCEPPAFYHRCDPVNRRCLCYDNSNNRFSFNCNAVNCGCNNLEEEGSSDDGNRMLKEASFVLKEGTGDFHDIVNACGDLEYEGSLYIDSHWYAVATPKQDAVAAGCPLLVTHSTFDTTETVAEKEIRAFHDHEIGRELFEEDALPIGSFKLSELHQAYDETDPAAAGPYDAFTNTCANYVIDLASNLGIEPDAKMTAFVARRLIETKSKALMDSIRQHVNFPSLFEGRSLRSVDASDEEVIMRMLARKS